MRQPQAVSGRCSCRPPGGRAERSRARGCPPPRTPRPGGEPREKPRRVFGGMFIGEQGRGPPTRPRRPRPGDAKQDALAGNLPQCLSWESTSSVAWTIGTSVSPFRGAGSTALSGQPASSSSTGEITSAYLSARSGVRPRMVAMTSPAGCEERKSWLARRVGLGLSRLYRRGLAVRLRVISGAAGRSPGAGGCAGRCLGAVLAPWKAAPVMQLRIGELASPRRCRKRSTGAVDVGVGQPQLRAGTGPSHDGQISPAHPSRHGAAGTRASHPRGPGTQNSPGSATAQREG